MMPAKLNPWPLPWCAVVGYCLTAVAARPAPAADALRVATFNVSLYGNRSGEVLARLERGDDPQAAHLAEIIQRVRPDVLLLNEIDYDADRAVLRAFREKYLERDQNNLKVPEASQAIVYPHQYAAPVNTGRHSGFDLDRNGIVDAKRRGEVYAGDCWGFGRYEGQYGMAVLSKYPIDEAAARSFQKIRWRDMPGAMLPDDPAKPDAADWYTAAELEQFPLSSKSHWDVPIVVGAKRIHLLASHPTPPVYDGAEDRNGRRNQDELRFWIDYVGPADGAAYITDDVGHRGGLEADGRVQGSGSRDQLKKSASPVVTDAPALGESLPAASGLQPAASFIILGDLNGDSFDGDGQVGIAKLLAAPRVLKYLPPESAGGAEQARLQGRINAHHRGDPRHDTADAAERPQPGNLRLDYVLPSSDLRVTASGVFWPEQNDPLFGMVGVDPFPSSDHRLVWIDLELDAR